MAGFHPAIPEAAMTDEPASNTPPGAIDLRREFAETGLVEVLDALDRDLVGLAPVKQRIREIAALLLVDRVRARMGLTSEAPVFFAGALARPWAAPGQLWIHYLSQYAM